MTIGQKLNDNYHFTIAKSKLKSSHWGALNDSNLKEKLCVLVIPVRLVQRLTILGPRCP
jgi:hypothetical protein